RDARCAMTSTLPLPTVRSDADQRNSFRRAEHSTAGATRRDWSCAKTCQRVSFASGQRVYELTCPLSQFRAYLCRVQRLSSAHGRSNRNTLCRACGICKFEISAPLCPPVPERTRWERLNRNKSKARRVPSMAVPEEAERNREPGQSPALPESRAISRSKRRGEPTSVPAAAAERDRCGL